MEVISDDDTNLAGIDCSENDQLLQCGIKSEISVSLNGEYTFLSSLLSKETSDAIRSPFTAVKTVKAIVHCTNDRLGQVDYKDAFKKFDTPKTEKTENLYTEPISEPNSGAKWEFPLDAVVDKNGLVVIADERIDGESFLELTNDDLITMKIKIGPRKHLLNIIIEAKRRDISVGNYVLGGDRSVLNIDSRVPQSKSSENLQSIAAVTAVIPSNAHSPNPLPSQSNSVSKPSADSFSRHGTVEGTLLLHAQGETILRAAENAFTEEDRRALIRILVSELVTVHDSYYPAEQAEIALAAAIVEEFPLLKDVRSAREYEHYFDNITKRDSIEYRLWMMRKNLSPSKKKYQDIACKLANSKAIKFLSSSEGSKLLPKEELDQKISLLKCDNLTDKNKGSIISYMDETFHDRRNWINNSNPTISQIFDLFPRLLDYNGEMIDIEFERLHRGCENTFLSIFPSYCVSRILAYAVLHRPNVYKRTNTIKNENLGALYILVDLLPVSNAILIKGKRPFEGVGKAGGRKRQRVDAEKMSEKEDNCDPQSEVAEQCLIRIVPEGTNLPQYVQNTHNQNDTNVQPYILCVQGQQKDTFVIQGDGSFISIHD